MRSIIHMALFIHYIVIINIKYAGRTSSKTLGKIFESSCFHALLAKHSVEYWAEHSKNVFFIAFSKARGKTFGRLSIKCRTFSRKLKTILWSSGGRKVSRALDRTRIKRFQCSARRTFSRALSRKLSLEPYAGRTLNSSSSRTFEKRCFKFSACRALNRT